MAACRLRAGSSVLNGARNFAPPSGITPDFIACSSVEIRGPDRTISGQSVRNFEILALSEYLSQIALSVCDD